MSGIQTVYCDSAFIFGRNHGFVVHCAYTKRNGIEEYAYIIKSNIHDNNIAELDALKFFITKYGISGIRYLTDSQYAIDNCNLIANEDKPNQIKHVDRMNNLVNRWIYMIVQDLRSKFINKKKSKEFSELVGKYHHIQIK